MRSVILVPARNEAESLPGLFEALHEARPEVLVVDNGSTDRTAAVARRLGAAVVGEPEPGYGRACQRGLAHLAAGDGRPDAVVFLDADDWLAARQVERLLGPLRRDRAELVIGSRRPAGNAPGVRRHAVLGNRMIAAALRGLYGVPRSDPGPFRAARFGALRKLGLDDPDFGWNVQMEVRALRRGYRVREVPVLFERRRVGRSKISGSFRASVRAGNRIIAAFCSELLRPPGACPGGNGAREPSRRR